MSDPVTAKLFLVSASNVAAKRHIEAAIAAAIPAELCDQHFGADFLNDVRARSGGVCHAWGVGDGPQNVMHWTEMTAGDYVVFYQDGRYTFVSRVIAKARNAEFAKTLWTGQRVPDDESDTVFELIFFVEPPIRIDVPGSALAEYLPSTVRRFMGVTEAQLGRIISDFGSVASFVQQRLTARRPTRAWIFQANPKRYDLRGAVRALHETNWLVTGYRDEIAPGDRVYLWEAGRESAVVAVAEVADQPSVRPLEEREKPFLRSDGLDEERLRVRLIIRQVLETPLARAQLRQEARLANLSIFKFANATNFPVSPEEAAVIDELLGRQSAKASGKPDLRSADVLRGLWARYRREDPYRSWREDLAAFLRIVANADVHERASYEFQKRLWNQNPVSSTGLGGSIAVDQALAEEEFRGWLAAESVQPLPSTPTELVRHLEALYGALVDRLEPVCAKVPHLKIIRALVAFYPRHLTTVADRGKVKDLHEALLGNRNGTAILQHVDIVRHLEGVLGPVPDDFEGLAWRLTFPWYLYDVAVGAVVVDGRPPDLAALAHDLLVTEQDLSDTIRLLERNRQVIFYGPPGTGKTFVARSLARFCAGAEGTVELVQFHASYAYEDFVEGYRPTLIGGQPGFRRAPGPLKRLALVAQQKPSATHVLLIDEINRSNVAKVFGELYYLLEYRDDEMTLQYSPEERFQLPGNIWIIGTMNTADRSIALVDAALRRRFAFVPFFPDRPPILGLLARWLARHQPALEWVADVVDLANERLKDRHMAIGPSYFMTSDLTEEWVRVIWAHKIVPYVEEHFFDDPDRLKDFDLEALRQAVATDAPTP